MDFTASELTTSAIALAALALAAWTARDARRSRAASERSAAAAERADHRAEETAAADAVHWRLEPFDLDHSQLVNGGPQPAHRVVVRLSPRTPAGTPVVWGEWPIVLRGSAVPHPLILEGRGRDAWVEVTWQLNDEDGAQRRREQLPLFEMPRRPVTGS